MSLAAGSKLGLYEIVSLIGAGGMGEVYRARDTKLKRDVALKVLAKAFADDPARMARFQREAELLASLNHPNIAHLYGVEERALVMELVEGETLPCPLPIETALNYAKQIAEALEYAHERGVIHRDLKPGNIKVTPEGVVKVLDFGLAKAIDDPVPGADASNSPTLTLGATRVGMIMGTAAYMSPEQASGKQADRRADIWSFGAVLYETLTGKRAFEGESVSDTLAMVLKLDPDWDALPVSAPASIRKLVRRCLTKDRKQRLQAIGEARIGIEEAQAGVPQDRTAPLTDGASRRSLTPWMAAAVLLAVALGITITFWAPWRKPPAPAVVRFQIPPPEKTNYSNATLPVLSPDGRQLAFVASADGSNFGQVWIRSLDTLEARVLPGTENAGLVLFWSPDSRSLAFGYTTQQALGLKRAEVSGGPPQTLCETGNSVPTGSWGRADVIAFAHGGLFRVPAAGGDCSPLTKPDSARGESVHRSPSFLPDGRHFVYLRVSSRPENQGIYVGSLDAKPEQQSSSRLLPAESGAVYAPSPDSKAGYLLFVRQGTLMAQPFDPDRLELAGDAVLVAEHVAVFNSAVGGFFSASATGALAYRTGASAEGGNMRLTWFDRQGKVLDAAGDPGLYNSPALSPDGTRVAFNRIDNEGRGNVWLYDIARGNSTRFTFHPARDTAPVWSPDGSRIVFVAAEKDGPDNLFQKVSSGAGDEEPLLQSAESKTPTDWSRDGRFLLFTNTNPKTGADIWVLPMIGAHKPAPYLKTEFNESEARFSPDGRFVAYQSNASGANEIYVQPFPNPLGGKWMVSKGGGILPRWRRDGKELFYISGRNSGRLMVVAVTLSPVFQADIPKGYREFPPGPPAYDLTADGQKFIKFGLETVTPNSNEAQSPITVVLNWQAGLKK